MTKTTLKLPTPAIAPRFIIDMQYEVSQDIVPGWGHEVEDWINLARGHVERTGCNYEPVFLSSTVSLTNFSKYISLDSVSERQSRIGCDQVFNPVCVQSKIKWYENGQSLGTTRQALGLFGVTSEDMLHTLRSTHVAAKLLEEKGCVSREEWLFYVTNRRRNAEITSEVMHSRCIYAPLNLSPCYASATEALETMLNVCNNVGLNFIQGFSTLKVINPEKFKKA